MNVSVIQTKSGASRHFRERVFDVTTTTIITINMTMTGVKCNCNNSDKWDYYEGPMEEEEEEETV